MGRRVNLSNDQQAVVEGWADQAVELDSAGKEDELDALLERLDDKTVCSDEMYDEFHRLYMEKKLDSNPVLKKVASAMRIERGRSGHN